MAVLHRILININNWEKEIFQKILDYIDGWFISEKFPCFHHDTALMKIIKLPQTRCFDLSKVFENVGNIIATRNMHDLIPPNQEALFFLRFLWNPEEQIKYVTLTRPKGPQERSSNWQIGKETKIQKKNHTNKRIFWKSDKQMYRVTQTTRISGILADFVSFFSNRHGYHDY